MKINVNYKILLVIALLSRASLAAELHAATILSDRLIADSISHLRLNQLDMAYRNAWLSIFLDGKGQDVADVIKKNSCDRAKGLYLNGVDLLKEGLETFAKSKWESSRRASAGCDRPLPSKLEWKRLKYELVE